MEYDDWLFDWWPEGRLDLIGHGFVTDETLESTKRVKNAQEKKNQKRQMEPIPGIPLRCTFSNTAVYTYVIAC